MGAAVYEVIPSRGALCGVDCVCLRVCVVIHPIHSKRQSTPSGVYGGRVGRGHTGEGEHRSVLFLHSSFHLLSAVLTHSSRDNSSAVPFTRRP